MRFKDPNQHIFITLQT